MKADKTKAILRAIASLGPNVAFSRHDIQEKTGASYQLVAEIITKGEVRFPYDIFPLERANLRRLGKESPYFGLIPYCFDDSEGAPLKTMAPIDEVDPHREYFYVAPSVSDKILQLMSYLEY